MGPREDEHELSSVEVVIKFSEHGNPHVHAWYQGRKVKMFIKALDIEKGELPRKQTKIQPDWIVRRQDYLLERGEEITGLPVGE